MDKYECTASNGVSPDPTGSVELRGDWQSHAYTREHTVTIMLMVIMCQITNFLYSC